MMNKVAIVDAAWASGFYEGEGNVSFGARGGIRITITQVNREPLDRLQFLFGGTIYGPKNNGGPKDRPHYIWSVSSAPLVYNFAWQITPWLSELRLKSLMDKIEFKINMSDLRLEYCKNHHLRSTYGYRDRTGKQLCRRCIAISDAKRAARKKREE